MPLHKWVHQGCRPRIVEPRPPLPCLHTPGCTRILEHPLSRLRIRECTRLEAFLLRTPRHTQACTRIQELHLLQLRHTLACTPGLEHHLVCTLDLGLHPACTLVLATRPVQQCAPGTLECTQIIHSTR